MLNTRFDIVKFVDNDFELEVMADKSNVTIWLKAEEMAELFSVNRPAVVKHISNILSEGELDNSTCSVLEQVQVEGNREVKRNIKIYNLDMIISVGYRVKSQRGIIFRRWANKILKDYLLEGYVANNKRLEKLNKVVEIQNRMLSGVLNVDTQTLENVISKYTSALNLLDAYDHQNVIKPSGDTDYVKISYEECRNIIDSMKYSAESELFGAEKEKGKLDGILQAVYQNVYGSEVYPTKEEKAAHLLYFVVKDHPFTDGCKRIAATLFLEFLNRNKMLFKDDKLLISNGTLVATTLLCAESKPEEKDIMINVIMNLLKSDITE